MENVIPLKIDATLAPATSIDIEQIRKHWQEAVWKAEAEYDAVCPDGLLTFVDTDIAQRLREQANIFRSALGRTETDQIEIHGAAMVRGYQAAQRAIEAAFNVQKGCGRHPGPAPVRGATQREKYISRQSRIFKDWYHLYLLSADWEAKRQKVFARSNFTCEGCGEAPATQVHHLNYDRVGAELLFDLVAICRECHGRAHGAAA